MKSPFTLAALLLSALVPACAALPQIPGTTVVDSKQNREILEVCERYRHALEDRDGATLLSMAHPNYYEDSGTPNGDDDYGYEGLRQVIATRLAQVRSIRYNIEYRNVEVKGRHAQVAIRYDASFQIATDMGDRWERKQNDKRLDLEFDGHRWLFLSGM
jgi:hypothetical protein